VEDRGLLLGWSTALVGFDDPEYGGGDIDAYRDVFAEAARYMAELARIRRRCPGDDLTSLLATAEIDGHRLTDAELANFGSYLLLAATKPPGTCYHGRSWRCARHRASAFG
jgi:cytochrome P450